jgi:hypothetical protein
MKLTQVINVYFEREENRNAAFEKLPETYRRRFGKGELRIKTQD